MRTMLRKTLSTAALAGAAVALSVGTALAVPAMVEQGSNFRSGPGTSFRVLTTIRAGEVIDVRGCRSGWCAAAYGPYQGYIARSLLDMGYANAAPRYAPPRYAPPAVGFRYGYYDGPYWPRQRYGPAYGHYRPGVSLGFGFHFD